MTFKLEAVITRKVMKLEDRRQHNGNPAFRERSCIDHTGREFVSRSAMARFWKISEMILTGRLKRDWDVKTALTAPAGYKIPRRFWEDHEGTKFESVKAMCAHWGVSDATYRRRLKMGMTQKQALTAPKWYQQKGGQNDTNTAG